jgi:hypothetical protein
MRLTEPLPIEIYPYEYDYAYVAYKLQAGENMVIDNITISLKGYAKGVDANNRANQLAVFLLNDFEPDANGRIALNGHTPALLLGGSAAENCMDNAKTVTVNAASTYGESNEVYAVVVPFIAWASTSTNTLSGVDTSGARFIGITLNATEKEPTPVPSVKSHQLLLSGQLGVNFYMDLSALSDTEKAASYMEFEVNGETQTAAFDASNVNANGYYAFTAYVTSIQTAEKITPVFHYGDETVELEPYAVADYIAYIEEHSSDYDEETLALVRAVADYGHYAQPFLAEHNGWTVGDKYAEATEYFTEEYDYDTILAAVADKGLVKSIDGSAVTKVSYMLNLDAETGLDVFLTTSVEPTLDGGLTAEQVGNRYRISFTGIKAQELGDNLVITGDADGAFSVTVSGLSYVRAVLNNASFNAAAKDAVCALYGYYAAAVAYLN